MKEEKKRKSKGKLQLPDRIQDDEVRRGPSVVGLVLLQERLCRLDHAQTLTIVLGAYVVVDQFAHVTAGEPAARRPPPTAAATGSARPALAFVPTCNEGDGCL